jgi:hypothetical protein
VSAPVKIAAFLAVLGATFTVAWGVGAALDPIGGADDPPAHAPHDPAGHDTHGTGGSP